MKKRTTQRWLLSLLLILCLTLSVACAPRDPKPTEPERFDSDWTEVPENTNANLKYFGYFHSDGFLGSAPHYDSIADLQNSNIMMINSAWSIQQSVDALAAVKASGHKAFLSMHDFFTGGTTTVANSASLKANYEADWNARRNAIADYIADGTIFGFYFDEPAWHGVKEADFRTVTQLLRTQYPDVRVLNCMTVYDVGIAKFEGFPETTAAFNEFCTDVMYDSYANWNDDTRLGYLEKIKSKATNNQYIWGCPKGFSDNPEQIDQMAAHIKGFYTEAVQEPRYAGIISFSYADGTEADWGYGLKTFFSDDSEYYSRELRRLYINIGREIIGLEPYDFSQEIELTLVGLSEVYDVGESVVFPLAGAIDGTGNVLQVQSTITDPRGNTAAVTSSSFVPEYSGKYTFTATVGEGEDAISKSTGIHVRYPGEINMFESVGHALDATGTAADLWCWPRSYSTDVKRSGEGSLFVNTHVTDGEWPRVVFAKNGHQLWDMSDFDAISAWIYNPSTQPLKGITFFLTNEAESTDSALSVFYGKEIPAESWMQLVVTKDTITSIAKDLDITSFKIIIGQTASSYANRTPFYIDEVMFLKTQYDYGFESVYDKNLITGTAADLWCWPSSVVTDFGRDSQGSLKVTPHATDGTWPNIVFSSGFFQTFDLTAAEEISVWAYNPSDDAINGFGFKINNGEGVNQAAKTFALPSKVWTKMTITVDEVLALAANIDLSQAVISFTQLGGTYANRTEFFLDDFSVTLEPAEPPVDPEEPGDIVVGFETEDDLSAVYGTVDDYWSWPVSISTEQAKSGDSSLKITVRQDGGTWPRLQFKNGSLNEFDLTELDYISLYVYNTSDEDIVNLGFNVVDGDKQAQFVFTLAAGQWTEIKVTKAEILAKVDGIDLTSVKVYFAQMGATYENRSNLYLDDFAVVYVEQAE